MKGLLTLTLLLLSLFCIKSDTNCKPNELFDQEKKYV